MNLHFGVVDSTEPEKRQPIHRLFVVYDGRSGKVVHVHSCRGDAQFVEDARHSRMAMELALRGHEGKNLRVMSVPGELVVSGPVTLRVDVRSGEIEVRKAELPSKKAVGVRPSNGPSAA